MNHSARTLTAAILLILLARCASGAPFINLDFEQATVVPVSGGFISATAAFPGWAARLNGGGAHPSVRYNSLGANGIALWDLDNSPTFTIPLAEGAYMAVLESYTDLGTYYDAALTQVGDIPIGTRSIRLLGVDTRGPARVTLGGQTIPLISLGEIAPRVVLYAGDVTPFAGQTVELGLHGPASFWPIAVDDVRFSAIPVPEPISAAALLVAMGRTKRLRAAYVLRTQTCKENVSSGM
jgi:hypothetical protein